PDRTEFDGPGNYLSGSLSSSGGSVPCTFARFLEARGWCMARTGPGRNILQSPRHYPRDAFKLRNHSWRSGVCRLIEAIGFKFRNHRHDWYSPQNRGLQRKPTLACPATTMMT